MADEETASYHSDGEEDFFDDYTDSNERGLVVAVDYHMQHILELRATIYSQQEEIERLKEIISNYNDQFSTQSTSSMEDSPFFDRLSLQTSNEIQNNTNKRYFIGNEAENHQNLPNKRLKSDQSNNENIEDDLFSGFFVLPTR